MCEELFWIQVLPESSGTPFGKNIIGFVDLLEGDVDFDAIKKALTEINYDGYVTAEMIPYVHGRPEKTAAAMKKIFK